MAAARKIKSVRITTVDGYRVVNDVARVFTNGDRTITVMQDSNTKAVVTRLPFLRVSYTYHKTV